MSNLNHLSSKLLLVTETPPGTPNGFGVTLDCMFREIKHQVVYTDAAFKQYGDELGYTLAQVPYHPSGRFLLSFLAGKNSMEFISDHSELSKPVDSYHPCAFRGNSGFQVPMSGMVSKKIISFSTAQLPEAAWANPTVNVLCLIEEHLVNEG